MEHYTVIEEILYESQTGKPYRSFGIAAGNLRISDLSLEEQPVREFVERLNAEGLEIVHLEGAIEDFLGSL
ncbi:MAG: hypothetical protein KH334_04405 [Clostridiales bacterium]|nr:hypothetical protein [Clostridiales bacterium]